MQRFSALVAVAFLVACSGNTPLPPGPQTSEFGGFTRKRPASAASDLGRRLLDSGAFDSGDCYDVTAEDPVPSLSSVTTSYKGSAELRADFGPAISIEPANASVSAKVSLGDLTEHRIKEINFNPISGCATAEGAEVRYSSGAVDKLVARTVKAGRLEATAAAGGRVGFFYKFVGAGASGDAASYIQGASLYFYNDVKPYKTTLVQKPPFEVSVPDATEKVGPCNVLTETLDGDSWTGQLQCEGKRWPLAGRMRETLAVKTAPRVSYSVTAYPEGYQRLRLVVRRWLVEPQ